MQTLQLEDLKSALKSQHNAIQIMKAGTKTCSIPTEVYVLKSYRKDIKKPFISIFNPNNANIFSSIKTHLIICNNQTQ